MTIENWIAQNFDPITRVNINTYIPDFMVRRLFEKETGEKINQEQFRFAMDAAGFIGRQTRNGDWVFNISESEYRKLLRRLST